MEKKFEPVRAPARVLQVIYKIALSSNGLTLSRLATLTGLPKTSLLSLLRSLEASNYVVNVSGYYRLGPETITIANVISSNEKFLPTARPILESLFNEIEETVQLSVLATDEPTAESIEVLETQKPIRLSLPVGLRRPLYCCSIGKLLLAFQEDAWIDAYFAKTKLVAYTPQTVTDETMLRKELSEIRASGLSVSHQGMFEDSSGISAVVLNESGCLLGGVSVVAPTFRIMRDEERFKNLVLTAGRDISVRLGFQGQYSPKLAAV